MLMWTIEVRVVTCAAIVAEPLKSYYFRGLLPGPFRMSKSVFVFSSFSCFFSVLVPAVD